MKHIYFLLHFVLFSGFSIAQTFNGTGGAILDFQTLTRTINVSGLPSSINQSSFGLEQVCLTLTHTYDADISIRIIAPDGSSAFLADGNGSDGNDFTGTCFRSDASTSIATGSAPFSGTFKPIEQLGTINNNQNPNGSWSIEIKDNYGGDQGMLMNWSITFGNDPAVSSVFTSSNLPIVIINTNNQAIPDEPKIQASMKIIDNGYGNINYITDQPNAYNNLIGIERRGSTSGDFPQKSYGFETRNINGTAIDTIILGMPKEKDWILYAPYNDKTCMRNVLTYDLSNKMGHYASRTILCELVLNGQYKGIYTVMEKVKRDGDRVNISKLNPIDISGDEVTGGYIFKIDKTTGGSSSGWTSDFNSSNGTPINFIFHYPSAANIMPQQAEYIQAYVDSFETAVNGPNFSDPLLGYRKFIEPQTFLDFMILNEISKNVDGYRLSTYLHKEKDSKGGKLRMGPVWDFNLAWWNADYCEGNTASNWAYKFNDVCTGGEWEIPTWWDKMMQDPWFQDELKCRWTTLRQGILSEDSLFHFIDSVANYIDLAKNRHFETWPILGTYTWPNPNPIPNDYSGEIAAIKSWIQLRTQWLDSNIPGTCHLGMEDQKAISNLAVVPNPFESQFEVQFFAATPTKATINLEDLNGKNIHQTEIDVHYGENATVFQPNYELPAGIYFVKIISGSSAQILKVIKN